MSDEIKIITNGVWRDTLTWHELTAKERKKFDYLDSEIKQLDATFFRYKGNVYDMGEIMRCGRLEAFAAWDGYAPDTFFSGILVKLSRDGDTVKVGRYYS